MSWSELIASLSSPEAYPTPPAEVSVRHTHISVVYLADELAYKIKKPVNLGFLDFSTLERRHFYCNEEVRLNRRLAPDVYLGVVPVAMSARGLRFEGEGEPVEWAVKMRRLPDEATLLSRLRQGSLSPDTFVSLGRRIAAFHRDAEAGSDIAVHGSFRVVSHNCRENLEQALPHVGTTLTPALWERLRSANERELARLRDLIEARTRRGMTRDTHGDLHLDHVYAFPGLPPPGDLVVLDCVEFSDDYRCGDVVSDMAFLCMDLLYRDRPDLMTSFADVYFEATGDEEGRGLLSFYIAYRAAVRGKVDGMEAREPEVPEEERRSAAQSARAHWLLALGQLESPARRPALILTGGVPGSGKSRLAEGLEKGAGFTRISSDVVRKKLAGLAPTQSARAAFGEGIYTPAWNDRTYGECLSRAEAILLDGGRVVVDASFREERMRRRFLDMARRLAVPCLLFLRVAPEGVLRKRLAKRDDKSVSDADWGISRMAAQRWETLSEETARIATEIPHMVDKNAPLERALTVLQRAGLA